MEWGENSCFSCCREIPSFVGGASIKLYQPQHIAARAPVTAKLLHPDKKHNLLQTFGRACRTLNLTLTPWIAYKKKKTSFCLILQLINSWRRTEIAYKTKKTSFYLICVGGNVASKFLIEIKPKLPCWDIFDFVLIHLVGSVTFKLNLN